MKQKTLLYVLGGAAVLVGGGTAIYFATRTTTPSAPAAGATTPAAPPKGSNAPTTKTPAIIANAGATEIASFAAWLANNPPASLDPNTGNY